MLSSPRPRNKLRKQPPSSFSVSFRSNLPRLRVNVATTSTLQGDSLSSPSSPASAVTVSVCSQAPLLDDNYSLRRTSTAPTRKLIKPRPQSYAPLHDLPSTQSLTSYSPPLPPKPNLVRRSSSFLSLGSWRGHQESHLDTLEAAGSASRTRSVSEGHADTRDDWSAVSVISPVTRHTSQCFSLRRGANVA
jgi:hypothetical protein